MKKNFLFFIGIVVGSVLFFGCSSTSFSVNRIRHHEPEFAPISADNYTVLERVTGEATIKESGAGVFEGDTEMYGSLDTYDAVYLNISKGTVIKPATVFDAALGNAIYKMNEKADKLNADAILFVRAKTTVLNSGNTHAVTVHVSGTAVKLK